MEINSQRRRLTADEETETQQKTLAQVAVFFTLSNKLENNILTIDHLNHIYEIDQQIQSNAKYKKVCQKEYLECLPPISPLLYLYYRTDEMGMPKFDGKGIPLTSSQITQGLEYLVSKDGGYSFFDKQFNITARQSTAMAILYRFGCPLDGFTACKDRRDDQNSAVVDFVVNHMQPLLDQTWPGHIDAFYGSTQLVDEVVRNILFRDLLYALGAFGFLLIFMSCHLGSFSLAILGMFHILVSFPATYFVYHIWLGIPNMHLMNFLSVFGTYYLESSIITYKYM
jgi:hypothetical protein